MFNTLLRTMTNLSIDFLLGLLSMKMTREKNHRNSAKNSPAKLCTLIHKPVNLCICMLTGQLTK